MSLSISELKQKWEKDKDFYRSAEVGSGTQKFVKKVLNSAEVFNLEEGNLSTELESRSSEFTEETKTNKSRRADVVIYINQDIVIPVEVEKYGSIAAGEDQLKNYQADLEKQYGVLTDGNEWRFYNNNFYRTFTIEEILNETELLLTFWASYIRPKNYYVNFFEPLGQQKPFEQAHHLAVEDNRELFFKDITHLIKTFNKKLNISGYLAGIDEKLIPKKSVELSYAYIIQFILYKTLVDNEFGSFKNEFQDRTDAVKEALKNSSYKEALSTIRGISNQISQKIYRPFAKEQELINEKLNVIIDSPKAELSEVEAWLDVFVFVKKYDFANVKNDIFGYIYENYLKALYSDEQKGQYFTDPAVVNFMLDEIGYTSEKINNKYEEDPSSISIIDPSCGSGTFLYSATDRIAEAFNENGEASAKLIEDIVNKNVFGLDIEEFPLYLAEMNILMRLLPFVVNERYNNPIDKRIKVFWTKDSLAEFQDTELRNTLTDYSTSHQKAGLAENMSIFGEMSKKINFGYISYVRDEDDLADMKRSLEGTIDKRQRFDFVVGNPPYISYLECAKQKLPIFEMIKAKEVSLNNIYGMNLHSVPRYEKKYAPTPNLYAFFISLGGSLLKDGGKLCFIIPQTVLLSSALDVVRYHLAKFTQIEKIITFEERLFVNRGISQNKLIPTSSLIIVFKKGLAASSHSINIEHYKDAKTKFGKKIEQKKLVGRIENWNFLIHDERSNALHDKYRDINDTIGFYSDHKLAEHYFSDRFYFDRGFKYPQSAVAEKHHTGNDHYAIPKLDSRLYSCAITPKIIAASKLDVPHGSQGLAIYDARYKLAWPYMNPKRFFFCDKRVMFNFNQVVIASNHRKEMLYLFALLNSAMSSWILDFNLRSPAEKDVLVGIKAIKSYIRTPKITEHTKPIKDEIIKHSDTMLNCEKHNLSDFVNFSQLMQQRFDSVDVVGHSLKLTRNKEDVLLPIESSAEIIKKVVSGTKPGVEIVLSDLKSLPIVDLDKQRLIKEEIDRLFYKLYNLSPEEVSLVKSHNQ